MRSLFLAFSTFLPLTLAAAVGSAEELDFPPAPKTIKDAEAAGLLRLNTADLKTVMQGSMKVKNHKGDLATWELAPDGKLESRGAISYSGTWHISQDSGGLYCRNQSSGRKAAREQCYAVFKVQDGIHYFNFDVSDSFFQSVWRRITP